MLVRSRAGSDGGEGRDVGGGREEVGSDMVWREREEEREKGNRRRRGRRWGKEEEDGEKRF